jgi:hypothetical protein
MARGKTMIRSVLTETPEIGHDAAAVCAVLPCYQDSIGDGILVIRMDGSREWRPYTTRVWKERITKFHGVSVAIQRAIFAERWERLRNTPFFLPIGCVVFLPMPVRGTKRVEDDTSTGFIAVDAITQFIKREYITDPVFRDEYPDAKCAIQLNCGELIPCYLSYKHAVAMFALAQSIQTELREEHSYITEARLGGNRKMRREPIPTEPDDAKKHTVPPFPV